MTAVLLEMVRDHHFGDTTLKNVFARLAWEAADDGSDIEVSIETLADDCDLSTKTIQCALRTARHLGLLHLVERERGPWPKFDRLDLPQLAALPVTVSCIRRLAQRRGAA